MERERRETVMCIKFMSWFLFKSDIEWRKIETKVSGECGLSSLHIKRQNQGTCKSNIGEYPVHLYSYHGKTFEMYALTVHEWWITYDVNEMYSALERDPHKYLLKYHRRMCSKYHRNRNPIKICFSSQWLLSISIDDSIPYAQQASLTNPDHGAPL